MFGFLEEDGFELGESDKLGSKGRFAKRIDKFRDRNLSEWFFDFHDWTSKKLNAL